MSATPDPNPLSRRSFSLPVSRNSLDPQIEVLYTLNSARIVSFNTSSAPSRPGSSSGISTDDEEVGRLSWSTKFETTLAVGPLRIYRAPGSVAFLNCANALRPILPKSQAWCVDGDSKFVLQIRRPQYWRIEVANKTEADKSKVEELKQVLGEVLLFEKTPCPFQRDFVVEIPEAPTTPVTKRPWKPVQGPRPQTPLSPETAIEYGYGSTPFGRRASSASPLRQSLLSGRRNSELDLGSKMAVDGHRTSQTDWATPTNETTTTILEAEEPFVQPDLQEQIQTEQPQVLSLLAGPQPEVVEIVPETSAHGQELHTPITQDDSDNFSEATDDSHITPRPRGRLLPSIELSPKVESDVRETEIVQLPDEQIPTPPILSIITTPRSKQDETSPVLSVVSDEDSGFSSSVESFHTVQSWHSLSPTDSEPGSPSRPFPYCDDKLLVSKRPQNPREASELTITTQSPRTWEINSTPVPESMSPEPKTPTLVNDGSEKSEDEHFEVMTPPTTRQDLRHRATTSSNSRRRQLSPLPAAANLFSPNRAGPRHLQTGLHLPTAIIQKTCEILLSPPSHLFHLMLNIASKIAAGEWRGVLLGHGEAVQWDFENEYAEDGCFEDDYGIDLHPAVRKNEKPQSNSWEVD